MKLTTILLALAAAAGPGAALAALPVPKAAACAPAAAAGTAVRAARAELKALPLGEDETAVAPEASRRIERVKDRLRDLVRAEMACAPASPEPAALAAAMTARGGFIDVVAYDPDRRPPARHGAYLDYRVERVGSQPDMLAVVATVAINCGSDSMLMLYRRMGGRWRELMVRRSPPYREIKGGWEDLRFAVSPKDAQGRWFVATASTTPWCSSSWQGLPFALARPGPAPDRPDIFFESRTTTWLGGEEDLSLRAERDAFELHHIADSIDPAVHSRRHVRRYAVRGRSVHRVQPVAESVQDFVDEWIVSPWSEARDWSGPDPRLAGLQARLNGDHFQLLDEFASVRECGGGLTQVEISAHEGPGWFFLVKGGAKGPWTVERVERQSAAGCTGPDRLERD